MINILTILKSEEYSKPLTRTKIILLMMPNGLNFMNILLLISKLMMPMQTFISLKINSQKLFKILQNSDILKPRLKKMITLIQLCIIQMITNVTYLDIFNCVCLTLPGKNVPKESNSHQTDYNVLSKLLPPEPLNSQEKLKKDSSTLLLSYLMVSTWVTELVWMFSNSCKLPLFIII